MIHVLTINQDRKNANTFGVIQHNYVDQNFTNFDSLSPPVSL